MEKAIKWILASTSPRRIELLRAVGLDFEVIAPDVDEVPKKGESARQMVCRLSRAKAIAVAEQIDCESQDARFRFLVIAADTTVVDSKDKILGKPRTLAEADRMLVAIAGKRHSVFTGYTVLELGGAGRRTAPNAKQVWTRAVETQVKIRSLNLAERRAYLEQGESMDKAGAYAAQGFGMALVEKVSGSYTNVVGLPIEQLLSDLESRFRVGLFSWRVRPRG